MPGAVFAAYDVLADESLRSEIKDYSCAPAFLPFSRDSLPPFSPLPSLTLPSGWPTIPQVYVNGEFIGGCDIVLSLQNEGELKTLLDKAGALKKK